MQVSEQAKKDHLISSYVRALEKKAKEDVMVSRVALGILLLGLAIGWLGLLVIPEPLLGVGALVAGIGVLVGR